MSGVLNEFEATVAVYSLEENCVYMKGPNIRHSIFKFNIMCSRRVDGAHGSSSMHFFFNFDKMLCLLVIPTPKNLYNEGVLPFHCSLQRFTMKDDLPSLSVNIFGEATMQVMARDIANEFKEKYTARLLDGIINE
jgi:hypothetical protein